MSRSAITVGTPWPRAMDHARLCATVEAPMPPRTPKTEMVRPIGFTPAAVNISEMAAISPRGSTGAIR